MLAIAAKAAGWLDKASNARGLEAIDASAAGLVDKAAKALLFDSIAATADASIALDVPNWAAYATEALTALASAPGVFESEAKAAEFCAIDCATSLLF